MGWSQLRRETAEAYAEYGPEMFRISSKDTWEAHDGTAIAAKDTEPVYLIYGQLEEGTLNETYGKPGGKKTWVVLDKWISIAGGVPYLIPEDESSGMKPFDVVQAPVIWINFDMKTNRLFDRMKAFARAKGLDLATLPIKVYSNPQPRLNAAP